MAAETPIGDPIPVKPQPIEMVITVREGRFRVDGSVLPYQQTLNYFMIHGSLVGEKGEEIQNLEQSNVEVRRAMANCEKVLGRWLAFKDTRPSRPDVLDLLNHRHHVSLLQADIEPATNAALYAVIKAKGLLPSVKVE
jgi:hypothetical protein